jgi:hypothetical protein
MDVSVKLKVPSEVLGKKSLVSKYLILRLKVYWSGIGSKLSGQLVKALI